MNDKGFVFTMDAVLMLIPIIIIAAAVSNISLTVPHESPHYDAQDALDVLYYADTNRSIVNNLSLGTTQGVTNANNTIKSLKVLNSFNASYNLTYSINGGPFITLISNGTITDKSLVSTATRNYGNVTLTLYLWWG